MITSQSGRCECGACRYRIDDPVLCSYACHCRECQRGSSSDYSVQVLVEQSQVHVTGSVSVFRFDTRAGAQAAHRCAQCGGLLWYASPGGPSRLSVQAGTLDERGRCPVVAHIWVAEAVPWFVAQAGTNCFEQSPSLETLVKLWQERSSPWGSLSGGGDVRRWSQS